MSRHKPTVDLEYPTSAHGRIPAFHNVEEEAKFWDTRETAELLEEFTPVDATVSRELAEKLTLCLDRADRDALARYARRKGIGPSTLARMGIRKHLQQEAASESR